MQLQGYVSLNGIPEDSDLISNDHYLVLGDWLYSKAFNTGLQQRILGLLESEGVAITLVELSTRLSVKAPVLEQVLQQLKADDKVRMSRNAWMAGGGASEDALCREGQKLLELIRAKGKVGFEADKEKIPGSQKLLRNLARLGLWWLWKVKFITMLNFINP